VHEYGITQSIIETAEKYADNKPVKKIVLVIGESADVTGECIKLYFGIIAEGTVCENAVVEIETIKPMLKCKTCGALFERKPFSFACPCGGEGEPTEIGREFYIKHIEVEDSENV